MFCNIFEKLLCITILSCFVYQSNSIKISDVSRECIVEEWNTRNTEPFEQTIEDIPSNISYSYNYTAEPQLIGAYAFEQNITITFAGEEPFLGKKVYCQYYDCYRNTLNKDFLTQVSEEYVAVCPRRYGAKYISLSGMGNATQKMANIIPILNRVEKLKSSYLTVCVKGIVPKQRHYLHLAEFVEYYKLQGASSFTFYIGNVSNYDMFLYDDYLRTGDIEMIRMIPDTNPLSSFFFNDCRYRNVNVAKWTAIVDFNQIIEVVDNPTAPLLNILSRSIHLPQISARQQLFNCSAETYVSIYLNDELCLHEMRAPNCYNTNGTYFQTDSRIIQPNMDQKNVSPQLISNFLFRYYRNKNNKDGESRQFPADLITNLQTKVIDRIKYVYDIKQETCDRIKAVRFRHGIAAPCYDELVKQKLVRRFAFTAHSRFSNVS